MRRINYKKNLSINIILLLILVIGIGYAYLTSNLSISGTTEIAGNSWDIHFNNIVVSTGSVVPITGAVIDNNDNTKVNYSIRLEKPGDYYEFTVNVINDGTIDGMVNSIVSTVNNNPISNLPSYLDYTLTYEDGIEIANNHILRANNSETYKIRIQFKDDIENNELPSTTNSYNFSFRVEYVQKNTYGIPKPELPYYIYAGNTNKVKVADNISQIGTYYMDIDDAYSNINQFLFLRYKVSNYIITEVSVVVKSLDYYFFIGGDNGAAYDINKENMNYIYGIYEDSNGLLFNNDFAGNVYKNGVISLSLYYGGWACEIELDSSSHCEETHFFGG